MQALAAKADVKGRVKTAASERAGRLGERVRHQPVPLAVAVALVLGLAVVGYLASRRGD